MADTKISLLTDIVTLAAGDKLAVADASDLTVSKSATMTEVATYLKTVGMPNVLSLSSAYTNSTTTGTEVTGLSFNGLVAGTYYICWNLLFQSAATTTSVKFGVNYSGTVTRMSMTAQFPSAGVAAATGTWEDELNVTTGAVWGHLITRTETTTAPNLGPWVGVTAANVDHYCKVEGVVVVSDTGNLQLWSGSEVAASAITLSAGSNGVLIRVA